MSEPKVIESEPGAGAGTLRSSLSSSYGEKPEIQPCWLEIGLYGDASCPELQKHIHCRNCPVYSSAGIRLLDRPLPEDYRREWTAHFANQEPKRLPPARTSAIVFRVNTEWLALPTQAFQEVAERRRIHSLPHRRDGIVLGLVNIRGELLVCADLGRALGLDRGISALSDRLKSSERKASTTAGGKKQAGCVSYERLLVVSWEGNRLVFPVNEVEGIHRFQALELKAPPATVAKSNQSYTQGLLLWQEKSIGLLNAEALFPAINRTLL